MLLLTKGDVAQAIDGVDVMAGVIEAVEDALADTADDPRPRPPAVYPSPGAGETAIPLMGVLRRRGLLGGRVSTIGAPTAAGPGGRGYKLLFDLATLRLVAMIEDVGVHPTMVGAHVGVATRWLALPGPTTVGLLGSGTMAEACLEAVCAVRPVTGGRVFSPTPERREAFARRASERFGVEVAPVGSPEEAVQGAGVVNCATNNYFRGGTSVFRAEWLEPGAHVNTIGRAEAPADCGRVATLFPPSVPDYDAIVPPWDPPATPSGDGPPLDLANVVAGRRPGRSRAEEITVYLGPSIPAEHLAIGAWVYERARQAGVGTTWDDTMPVTEENAS